MRGVPKSIASYKPLLVALLCWIVLSSFFFAIHAALWFHDLGPRFEPWGWLLKPIGNLVHALAMPGWLIARLTLNSYGEVDRFATAFACSTAAAILVLLVAWLRAVRRTLAKHVLPAQNKAPEAKSDLKDGIPRRRLLVDGILLGSGAAASASLVQATCIAPAQLRLQTYEIPIADLPESLDGVRLVQLSDTHLGPRVPRESIDRAIDMAIARNPDVFLLTDDYVHCGAEWTDPAAEMFRRLTDTGLPTIGVLGNHDWYNGGEAMKRALRQMGVRVIDNDHTLLASEGGVVQVVSTNAPEAGDLLCIAGFGDLREDHVDPHAALSGVDPRIPRIVLSHNPDAAEIASVAGANAPRIDLIISGHTHGGQVRLPGVGTATSLLSKYGDKYSSGLVQGPRCPVIISNGVGISLVPFRFLVPPEVVEITLRRSVSADLGHKLDRV